MRVCVMIALTMVAGCFFEPAMNVIDLPPPRDVGPLTIVAPQPDASSVDGGVVTSVDASDSDAEMALHPDAVVSTTDVGVLVDGGVSAPDAEPQADVEIHDGHTADVEELDLGGFADADQADASSPDVPSFPDVMSADVGFVTPDATPAADVQFPDAQAPDAQSFPDATVPDTGMQDAGPRVPVGYVVVSAGTYPIGTGSQAGMVTMPYRLAVSTTELSYAQYRALMGRNAPGYTGGDQYPVNSITSLEMAVFLNQLSLMHGFTPCYNGNGEVTNVASCGCRLPTSTEWEILARAGEVGVELSGLNGVSPTDLTGCQPTSDWDEVLSTVATYCPNSRGGFQVVGQKTMTNPFDFSTFQTVPNAWGLWDVHGNVAEATEGCNEPVVPAGTTSMIAVPQLIGCASRVWRGGSWISQGHEVGFSSQIADQRSMTATTYGLRPVCRLP